ncbi:MAG: hypothetical protein ACI8UO_003835 [Verrucomicrobiales bacterium]|jgi:hypothetical protein
MKAPTILITSLLMGSLFPLNAGVPGEEPLFEEEPEIPIEKIHSETLKKFIEAQGFGYSRKISIPKGPGDRNHQFTDFMKGDEGFRVALIGLVKREAGTVYPAAADFKEETNEEGLQRFLELGQKGFEESSEDPPDDLDNHAIEVFREGQKDAPLTGKVDGNWTAHGPIRATQESCMKCHDVERGTLLGVFRYEFSVTK